MSMKIWRLPFILGHSVKYETSKSFRWEDETIYSFSDLFVILTGIILRTIGTLVNPTLVVIETLVVLLPGYFSPGVWLHL